MKPQHHGAQNATQMRGRILIVEDVPCNLWLHSVVLGVYGYMVHGSATGAEALQRLENETYDAVLLDLGLPDMLGLDLARQLRMRPDLSHMTIVAVTGCLMPGDREAALDAGCDAFVAKPIDTHALGPMLETLIERQRSKSLTKASSV